MSFSLSEYTKINAGWGFAPDRTGESLLLTALPRPPSWFQGGPLRGRTGMEGREGLGGGGKEGKGGEGGMEREGERGSD